MHDPLLADLTLWYDRKIHCFQQVKSNFWGYSLKLWVIVAKVSDEDDRAFSFKKTHINRCGGISTIHYTKLY